MQSLFESVHAATTDSIWEQGASLAEHDGSVLLVFGNKDELVVRVLTRDRLVAPTVALYQEGSHWSCDCGSAKEACSHVVAAVIAARLDEGKLPLLSESGTQLEYHFTSSENVSVPLVLERHIGGKHLTDPLQTLSGVCLDQLDLAVDAMFEQASGLAFTPHQLSLILGALDGANTITLDGAAVYASGDIVLPLGVVRDVRGGVRLEVVANPVVTKVLGSGVALCGDTLQPLGHTEITGERLEQLPFGKMIPPADYAALVTETIPQLEADIPMEIRTTRLPEVSDSAQPRIDFEIQQGATLKVLPTLVYGTPALARIEGDKMIHLRGMAPVRDRSLERELLSQLREELHLVPGREVEYYGTNAVRLTDKLEVWYHARADGNASEYILDRALVPNIDVSDGFDITFESTEVGPGGRRRASATAVIGAWQSGLELVPLMGGGWAPLPTEWLAEHGDRVADLLAAREADKTVPLFALPTLAALCEELDEPLPPATEAMTALLRGFEGIAPTDLPEDFTGELRSYQKSGVDWLCCLRDAGLGAVLADDMGLGKTVQALCAFKGRTLVVCPTSVLPTWLAEIQRFRPSLTTSVYHGASRVLDDTADVTVTTYSLLRIDAKRLSAVDWDVVVLDEAQAIKNPQSQVARAAHKMRAGFRMALSGTPIENRLDELWSQFHFTNRGLLGGRADFQKRHARPIARQEAHAAQKLRDKIRPFLLRRLKADVAPELPPRTDAVIYCELDEDERMLYDSIHAATQRDVVAQLRAGGGVMQALEALLRLRQAATHRALVPGQAAKSSSKVRELLSALDTAISEGHKALVFSQWTSMLDLVEPHLNEAGIKFTRLDGSTRKRGEVVEAFQDPEGPPVMLVSLKAGGTGLTLTAADHVFLMDLWWNPAVEDQAADRTHRIGQDHPVMVYRMVGAETVETRILALQDKKRAIAEAALGGSDRAAGLTREDLLGLLQ